MCTAGKTSPVAGETDSGEEVSEAKHRHTRGVGREDSHTVWGPGPSPSRVQLHPGVLRNSPCFAKAGTRAPRQQEPCSRSPLACPPTGEGALGFVGMGLGVPAHHPDLLCSRNPTCWRVHHLGCASSDPQGLLSPSLCWGHGGEPTGMAFRLQGSRRRHDPKK